MLYTSHFVITRRRVVDIHTNNLVTTYTLPWMYTTKMRLVKTLLETKRGKTIEEK